MVQSLKDQAYTLIKKSLNSLCPEPHNEQKLIGLDGSGEIFSSEVYRNLFETEKIFNNTDLWPNLKFIVNTNGTMMTPKIQNKYRDFFRHITMMNISIDAGNERSYDLVRVGGNWDLLWKNINYFYQVHKSNKDISWTWNLIIQKNNYESIPELINLANKYTEKLPIIYLTNVVNWGTWDEEQYLNNSVHLPTHAEHQKFLNIMNLAVVKNYPLIKR